MHPAGYACKIHGKRIEMHYSITAKILSTNTWLSGRKGFGWNLLLACWQQRRTELTHWLSCGFTSHSGTQNRSFWRCFRKPISWLGVGRKTNLTQQKHAFTNQKKCTTTQNQHKKLRSGLVVFYDIRPGNRAGLFSKEKISKGGGKWGKSEEKGMQGSIRYKQANNIYTQHQNQKSSSGRITPRSPHGVCQIGGKGIEMHYSIIAQILATNTNTWPSRQKSRGWNLLLLSQQQDALKNNCTETELNATERMGWLTRTVGRLHWWLWVHGPWCTDWKWYHSTGPVPQVGHLDTVT